ncbi:MAG: UDP-N-acetylmuramate--L-alanine ligase [Acidobacteria bacterium]|nr:UDP-N-acetylmuramate--L-alanine ligase [Acidobacteriota bacterium]
MFFEDIAVKHRHIHFVGIGGIGMSGLAEILLSLGYTISGSDIRSTPITERLESLGARVLQGHAASNIAGADAVVVSSAIQESNPEQAAAVTARIPVIQRGELLAELMRLKYGIAIAGSHGKTTTTSMTAAVLHGAGKDPTVVVGGRVDSMGSNARLGKSSLLLAEADESDGSFLRLAPIVAVITTLDQEHLDHYGTYGALVDGFVAFANKVPFYGAALLGIDDPQVRAILPRIQKPVRTYGTTPDADLVASSITCGGHGSRFRLAYRGDDLGWFEVKSLGIHNVNNAVAAVLVGLELSIEPDAIRTGLASFSGVDRRFQVRGQEGGVTVIDDYGHHPTEIAATLAAARMADFERVIVVFQPHRYTRTAALMDGFAHCFGDCDRLFVVDIYSAGEDPIEGVHAEELTRRIRAAGSPPVQYMASIEDGIAAAAVAAQEGDVVVTLGAGNISQAGPPLLEKLAAMTGGVRAASGTKA